MKNVLLKPCSESGINKGRFGRLLSGSSQTFRVLTLIGVFVLAVFTQVNAQTVTVRGKVTDEKGAPILGATVQVKGASTGTNTDGGGMYTIAVPSTGTLVFTLIGYTNQEVAVAGKTTVDVVLKESTQDLDEVVVTALGVSKTKRGLSYSVTEVKGEEFTEVRNNNIASALTGKIAGVDAAQINAGPGASSRVVIRGNTGLSGNNQPLYVVNGLPMASRSEGAGTSTTGLNVDRGDAISSINPDDIESISVLKGGAAAALYGSQAANGVILITTKSGKAQSGVGIDVNSNSTVGSPLLYPNYQYTFGQGNDGIKPVDKATSLSSGRLSFGARIDGSSVIQFDGVARPYVAVPVEDNVKNFYRPETNLTNTIAFSGGSSSSQFRLSASDLRSEAEQPNSWFKRKSANLNGKAQLGKNNFITVESTIQYNLETGKNRPNVGYAELNAAWPTYLAANTVDVRNMGPLGYDPVTGKEVEWNPVPAAVNPYYLINKVGNGDDRQRLIAQGKLRFNILKNLYASGEASRDFNYRTYYDYVPSGNAFTPTGYLNTSNSQSDLTILRANVGYNATFLKDFSITALAGVENQRTTSYGSTANGSIFIIPDFISLSNLSTIGSANRSRGKGGYNSAYGSADISWKNLLYVTLTARNDWFSTLNPATNSILYPSIGTSFILSDAVKLPSVFSSVKLRASYAQVGSATGVGSVKTTYTISSLNAYGLPTQSNNNTLRNPFIKPLSVTTTEVGTEVSLLGARLGFDLALYNKVTTDDILTPPISAYSGYGAGQVNIGKLSNKGIELAINGTPLKSTNFSWDVNLNGAFNRSKIERLAPGITTLSLGSAIGGPTVLNAVGIPYGSIIATSYLKNAAGVQVYNKTSNYQVSFVDTLGVGTPPYQFGFSNDFRYKKFSLSVLLDAKFGAIGYSNLMQYATRFGLTPMTLPEREAGIKLTGVDQTGAAYNYQWKPADMDTYYNQQGSGYTSNFVYSTDFVKLRTVSLRYSLPVSKLKFLHLTGADISVVGRNLAILYRGAGVKAAGIDPELGESTSSAQGTGGVNMPTQRVLGLN